MKPRIQRISVILSPVYLSNCQVFLIAVVFTLDYLHLNLQVKISLNVISIQCIGLAKKVPLDFPIMLYRKKPEQTFWPTQYKNVDSWTLF